MDASLVRLDRCRTVSQPSSCISVSWPSDDDTSIDRYAIQLAKIAGLRVATTASPKKHDLVKSLGAEVVVDYKVS